MAVVRELFLPVPTTAKLDIVGPQPEDERRAAPVANAAQQIP
jgi:hypothetical protein